MTYDVKALGQWVEYQRRSWGLSQDELATNIGLTQRKISRIERGQIADPGFADVARIAYWFGVSMAHVAVLAGLIDRNEVSG